MAEGLLKKIAPFARGVAGAAAVGANPLLGLLAGSSLTSTRDRKQLENDRRREELRALKRRNDAQEELRGLLASNTTVQEPTRSVGLLGPEQTETISIPGRRESVPTASTAQGQRDMLGLLSQASPDTFAAQATQTVLGGDQQRAAPSDIRAMQILGFPLTPEGFTDFNNRKANDSDGLLREIQARMAGLELEGLEDEREQSERERRKERTEFESGINRNLGNVSKLAELNRGLTNTFLESGLPASELRRDAASTFGGLMQLAGLDPSEQKRQVAQFDELRKGLNNLIIDTTDRFGNNLTNDKLALLENASASVDISPAATASILADVAEIYLEQADFEKVPVKNRRELEALIKRERNFLGTSGGGDRNSGPVRRRTFNPETGRLE